MVGIALGARALLIVVFLTAAIGKLTDEEGTQRALVGFRVPRQAVRGLALLLPLAELATAVALAIELSARWGAISALLLLSAFAAGIARAMSRGEAPDCHCFGQISSAPAGPATLARNGALALPALFVAVYGPGESFTALFTSQSAAATAAVAACFVLTALLVTSIQLWLERRELKRDLVVIQQADSVMPPGLPVGTAAPKFALADLEGRRRTLDAFLERGHPVAMVFISPGCFPCVAMLPELARWQTTLADRITIALLVSGNADEARQLAEEHGLTNVLIQTNAEVFKAYRARATPSAVIVRPDGTIGSQTSSTELLVQTLIRRALTDDTGPLLRVTSVGSDDHGVSESLRSSNPARV